MKITVEQLMQMIQQVAPESDAMAVEILNIARGRPTFAVTMALATAIVALETFLESDGGTFDVVLAATRDMNRQKQSLN